MQQVSQRPVVPPSPLSLVTFTESMTTGAWPRGWPTPSCDVIASLATITGNPNLTLAAIAGMTRTQFSALCSEKRWLAGHQISYAAFRLIAVATGMVEHVVIPQRIVPLRPEIFKPMLPGFRQITRNAFIWRLDVAWAKRLMTLSLLWRLA